ncbi:hypothetical protein SKAU_G00316380 [Synaphobranchus kaupii]|uniref:Uncharacterized protein n=1 Tax=Synaphobranchus kaupii TaxID=118154 RepID=A0A9Q1ESV7_SYNKA|nr:hypothetical protein SKAU_G00316380 [Synaphobranchus kaupii]
MMLKVFVVFAVVALSLIALSESKKPVGCFNKNELMDDGEHFVTKYLHLSHGHMVQSLEDPNPRTVQSCSNFILQTSSAEYHNRSVSPWRYRIHHDEERYPSKIAVAECLCEGPEGRRQNLRGRKCGVSQADVVSYRGAEQKQRAES